MAGDILLTSKLVWLSGSSGYHRALDFLINETTEPQVRAAIVEANTNLPVLDLELFPIEARDRIYELLRDKWVPYARAQFSHDEGLYELADLAASALDEHRGRRVAHQEIRLGPRLCWRTQKAPCMRVTSLLADAVPDSGLRVRLRAFLDQSPFDRPDDLDLSDLSSDQTRECLRLIRDHLVPNFLETFPTDSPRLPWELAKLQELVDLATEGLAEEEQTSD